jgi:competence protein ComEC
VNLDRARAWLAGRPHHVGVAAFAGGLALAIAPPFAAIAAAAFVAAAFATARLPRLAPLAAGLLLLGALIGAWRLDAIDRSAERAGPAGAALEGRAVVLEAPRPSLFGSTAVLRMESGRARGTRVLARADGELRWPDGGEVGTIVALRGSVERPDRGESFDWRAHLRRRGIAYEVELDRLRGTGERRGGLAGAIDSMRRRGEHALEAGLPGDRAALARGMVLGQDERIDRLEREDFQRSGLAHVLAVSGQNVMLLSLLALPFLRAARAGPRARVLVPLALIAVYVPLAGAGPSLQRAGVMGAAGLVALAAGRASSRWYALGLAAAVTLALNPRAAGEPGWQLSFAAVVGILLLATPIERALSGLPRILAKGVAITLAATLATAPLMAHHFETFSLAGLAANVVALPLVAPIMWIGMVQVALAQLAALVPAAGLGIGPLGALDGIVLGLLQRVVRAFAAAPGASIELPLRSPLAVVAAYGLLAAAALAVARTARRNEPRARSAAAGLRRLPRRGRAALAAGCAALVALAWTSATAAPPPERPTVRFLDVGQGDATLIQDGAGASVLFDGGPPEARVYRLLREAGVDRLDLMVATHKSRDHTGGLPEVLERIPTRLLAENGDGARDPDFRALLATARERGVRAVPARAGQTLRVGRLRIEILGPPPLAPGESPPEDPNPRGVAAIVSAGEFDVWLSADAESDAILNYPLRPVEAMKVSHHGSDDPGLPELLDRLRPQVAAIEVGEGNTYGHPTRETLKALHGAVPHVYRTDEDGTITLTADGEAMSVATER